MRHRLQWFNHVRSHCLTEMSTSPTLLVGHGTLYHTLHYALAAVPISWRYGAVPLRLFIAATGKDWTEPVCWLQFSSGNVKIASLLTQLIDLITHHFHLTLEPVAIIFERIYLWPIDKLICMMVQRLAEKNFEMRWVPSAFLHCVSKTPS